MKNENVKRGITVRNQFIEDQDEVSLRTGLACLDPSRAVQSQKDDADINVIVGRFGIGATLPVSPKIPSYGDFTEVKDYQTALEAIRSAESDFLELPARVREVFDNSPQKLLEAATSEAGRELLVKAGLVPEPPPPATPA